GKRKLFVSVENAYRSYPAQIGEDGIRALSRIPAVDISVDLSPYRWLVRLILPVGQFGEIGFSFVRLRTPISASRIKELIGRRSVLSLIEAVIGIHLAGAVEKPLGARRLLVTRSITSAINPTKGCFPRELQSKLTIRLHFNTCQ